ncbi:MAG: protein-glutamate O-methyltransferase CheR [Fibrobacteria bacterium]
MKGKSKPADAGTPVEKTGFGPLLEGMADKYGYDFRDYARAGLNNRIKAFMNAEAITTVGELTDRILGEPGCMRRFLATMSMGTTSMFWDREFYAGFRKEIIPALRTFPFIRIWHAGCSTGQEAYSMAVLMQEEGLYERCRIYGTDIDDAALRRAKEGIFSLRAMRRCTSNYIAAGGRAAFSDYYTARYENAIIASGLRKNIVFANHNLVSDGSFNEFHVIICRNVLTLFNERLRQKVHRLFHESMAMFGYLALGPKDSLLAGGLADAYSEANALNNMYRKIA